MPWIEPDSEGVCHFPDSFIRHWNYLALSTPQADPFCCAPAWGLAFQQAISPFRRVFYDACLQGALIFCGYGERGRAPAIAPLDDSWLYGQPVLGPEGPDLLADALPELCAPFGGRVPPIVISGVMEKSFFAAKLFALFSGRFKFFRRAFMSQCSASLAGGVDGWLSRRSANCRAKLKKALRRAKAEGVEFERALPDEISAAEIYERMLAIEARSWKGIGHCGMAEPPMKQFYERMIGILAKDRGALVIFARIGEKDLGFIFGGLAGDIYRGQQFSFDQDYAALSPGNLMQFAKINWLCEIGCARYDMGPAIGPKMQYKRHWTERAQDFQAWVMRKDC